MKVDLKIEIQPMKLRLDQLLVQQGLVPTRSQAKLLIEAGRVKAHGAPLTRANLMVDESTPISVEGPRYVGRGAEKIAHALKTFGIDPKGKIVADVGASTGGFTDYLLQHGATRSYAVDVGRGQLADPLKTDPRVISLEDTDVRTMKPLPELVDLAVADLSFISLRLCLKPILDLIKPNGEAICLFKPQFEGGPKALGKKGVVRDTTKRHQILDDFVIWCKQNHFKIDGITDSPIAGKEGNREYLIRFGLKN
jgi:23S rRNA (cytidine1920-2'-O)/16S rRNA (cytidine1409-2'-O)-methyltransferase